MNKELVDLIKAIKRTANVKSTCPLWTNKVANILNKLPAQDQINLEKAIENIRLSGITGVELK